MTYWRYWDLNGAPFSGDSVQPLFRGASVEEALARIEFLVSNRRNIGLLLGPSGVGKTAILREMASHPPITEEVPNVRCVRKSLMGLGSGELLHGLAASLIGNRSWVQSINERSGAVWNCLCDYFNAAQTENVQTVLLLDDAESSTAEAELELCRMLSMSFPLTVVLAVDSELTAAISSTLLGRTELQIDLLGWDVSQTAEFLNWNISRVGRHQPIFTDSAIERIQDLSSGVPRRIVQISDLALVAGAVSQLEFVDADCVDQVAYELPRSAVA